MTAGDEPGAVTVPVLLDGWQIECCGQARSVGDLVSWQLNWNAEYATRLPSSMRLRAQLERYSAADADPWYSSGTPVPGAAGKTVPAMAKVGGLAVFLLAPESLAEVTLTGVLHEDHHIDIPHDFPATTGRITAVWLVSWEYERREDGAYHPAEGSAEFDETTQVPKWLPSRETRGARERWRSTNSVLVNLKVAAR